MSIDLREVTTKCIRVMYTEDMTTQSTTIVRRFPVIVATIATVNLIWVGPLAPILY